MKCMLAAGALVLALAGCVPRVSLIYGDSLNSQVTATPIEDGDGRIWRSANGAGLDDWADRVIHSFHSGPRDVVLALGTNDALDGWGDHDVAVWSWVLAAAQRDDCVTVVLPWVAASAEAAHPGITAEVYEARVWLRAHTRLVDWAPTVQAHPEYLSTDGIHLASFGTIVTPPVQARYAVVGTAADRCEA